MCCNRTSARPMSGKPGHALLDQGANSCIITDRPDTVISCRSTPPHKTVRALPSALPVGIVGARKHQPSWLRGDLLAEVTVAAYLVPQVRAYAESCMSPTGQEPFSAHETSAWAEPGRAELPLPTWRQEARVPSSMIIDNECARCH